MDDFNRESLAIEVDTSLPSSRVIRVLEKLIDITNGSLYEHLYVANHDVVNSLDGNNQFPAI